ncbi:MAG TPA: chemoreceptor glutamine deamidase/glutamate methylesterase CheD [Fervidobacterium sp.]|nr:chemotaxis protein CheD [Fervidobacterium sp.]HOQ40157.1 chemoreceptor glutamine deamidase/glutamate methylesterase CheD [Fervidobacterium sp.]HPT53390.1 chemoreceptor glutamine deamidase/glutamate methylesterase CheD [Fervidobacterium sp.]HPZ16872.1 chemoreceptor glutamine deamidase/glutamate methylesterase CheD [Fervidobacterium sp.]HQE47869.1 chemoreceptor glutamine deamidase/glutamate methylesterase CheD [Fervidobacterium sp.]
MKKKVIIGIGEWAVEKNPAILVTLGLGSCIGVCIRDPMARIGGMVHVMLPDSGGKPTNTPGKFADSGISLIIDELIKMGGQRSRLEAKVAGGASMFQSAMDIGSRNIEAVLKTLERNGVKLVAKDVGGNKARSIEYDIESGKLMVRKVKTGDAVEVSEI